MNNHSCIKCQAEYKDSEVDDYYCPACVEQKKEIAKEVDRKIKARGIIRETKSNIQVYDEICKARKSRFVSITDLGIKL